MKTTIMCLSMCHPSHARRWSWDKIYQKDYRKLMWCLIMIIIFVCLLSKLTIH